MTSKRNRKSKSSNQKGTNGSEPVQQCGSSHRPSRLATLPSAKILIHQFLQTMRMRNCSQRTIHCWRYILERFVAWCGERSVDCVSEVTPEIMAAYRRSLFHYRNPRTGQPLKFDTQAHYLVPIRSWFAWLKAAQFIELDPTPHIELPKGEQRLPTSVLTADQVETVLNIPDLNKPTGFRDRTILETFYSSSIRCGELVALDVYDISYEREILTVRLGKNKKDRVVPIGSRALTWVRKWTEEIRPELLTDTSGSALFVSKNGRRLGPNYLSNLVKRYLRAGGIEFRGSCHLIRHSSATLMMEGGADIRTLQEILGHARLDTTQIYTHVSIQRLQEVHRRRIPPNPTANHRRPPIGLG